MGSVSAVTLINEFSLYTKNCLGDSSRVFCAETAATVDSRWQTPQSRGSGYQLSHLANCSKHISAQKRFWPQQHHPSISLCTKPCWPSSTKLSSALKERGRQGGKREREAEGREKILWRCNFQGGISSRLTLSYRCHFFMLWKLSRKKVKKMKHNSCTEACW